MNPCCPMCGCDLTEREPGLACGRCQRKYSVVAGIPDLRTFGPLEGSMQEDLEDALLLDSYAPRATFHELIAINAERSKSSRVRSEVTIDLYTGMTLAAEQREANRLKELTYIADKYSLPLQFAGVALDLGTGMGPALPLLAERFEHVVAIDISLKHLVIARKRCEERSIANVTFLCACAEHLPLPGRCCSLVNSADVLEHVADSERYLREVERVLAGGGTYWASTPNRYTILPEGHVNLWGIGFLPRALHKPYVRLMRKTAYDGIRPVSYGELRRSLSTIFSDFRIFLPTDMNEVLEPHPGVRPSLLWRAARSYWSFVSRYSITTAASSLLERTFYPQFRFVGRKK